MREIKFRAWDKQYKKTGDVTSIKISPCLYTQINFAIRDDRGKRLDRVSLLDDNMFGTCILMQYTGLKDKNGKEIYEGDILGDMIGGYVVWIEKEARFGIDVCGETGEVRLDEYEQDELEVIGNIHDTDGDAND